MYSMVKTNYTTRFHAVTIEQQQKVIVLVDMKTAIMKFHIMAVFI